MPTLLLSEDNPRIGRQLRESLAGGFWVIESPNPVITLDYVRGKSVDALILVASGERPGDGLELARQVRKLDKGLPLVLVARESSEELAIDAIKTGINDYFRWPVPFEELAASVKRCLGTSRPPLPNLGSAGPSKMVGAGQTVEQIKSCISRLAATRSNVLVTGETGTGKELVAEMIHADSVRAKKPFVCINCAAIPDMLLESEFFGYEKGAFTGAQVSKPGKLRMADGGTVFFDEIGDMTAYAQAKILRTIESKEIQPLGGKGGVPVDFRVIAATNHDLEKLSTEGKFRQDLYFRLNVGRIHLRPLRQRKEDIPALIQYYIAEFNRLFGREVEGFTEEALDYLLAYDWPGNIRELRNALEAAFVNLPPGPVRVIDLAEPFRKRIPAAYATPISERDHLLSMLLSTNWNKSKTAEKLNWSRMTIYRKLAKYHITRNPQKKNAVDPPRDKNVTSSDAA
jgi:DNA-binding NtrC family response regulator